MKICGIIAEYNPFHNGHLYHLQKAMDLSAADYNVIVMSGNFVQRGMPAIADKFVRTEMALRCGADLVLELPSCYATGSAEFFAAGAVSLLNKLGAVTHLCFGSECGDILLLQKAASILAEETKDYQEILRKKLREGLSFPAARGTALLEYCPELNDTPQILTSPNNTLGIEYLKALYKQNSDICPITVARCGSDYNEEKLADTLSSATAIRRSLKNGMELSGISGQFPYNAYSVLKNYESNMPMVFSEDLSSMLYYKLLSEQNMGYTSYMDVSEELSDRIRKNLYHFTTFPAFCDLLKTKEMTHSRISRCLVHILLNIRKEDLAHYINSLEYTPYARVLGFRQTASPLLNTISKQTRIPLITKLADAGNILSEGALDMLQKDIYGSHIYNSILTAKTKKAMRNEYATPLVII